MAISKSELTKENIGWRVVVNLHDWEKQTKYGYIVDFDDEFIYCSLNAAPGGSKDNKPEKIPYGGDVIFDFIQDGFFLSDINQETKDLQSQEESRRLNRVDALFDKGGKKPTKKTKRGRRKKTSTGTEAKKEPKPDSKARVFKSQYRTKRGLFLITAE